MQLISLKLPIYFRRVKFRCQSSGMKYRPDAIFVRFPEYRDKIENIITENEEFASLCEDYDQCINMLITIEKNTGHMDPDFQEFVEIKLELEQEILKYLF